MTDLGRRELYQQMILEHNRQPKNFGTLPKATHTAHGQNPLCGDEYDVHLSLGENNIIEDISFEGHGCAISKASASLMTVALKGRTISEAFLIFDEFHELITGKLKPGENSHHLGKLAVFAGIWQYPARVKCASLSWHTMKGALTSEKNVSTE